MKTKNKLYESSLSLVNSYLMCIYIFQNTIVHLFKFVSLFIYFNTHTCICYCVQVCCEVKLMKGVEVWNGTSVEIMPSFTPTIPYSKDSDTRHALDRFSVNTYVAKPENQYISICLFIRWPNLKGILYTDRNLLPRIWKWLF